MLILRRNTEEKIPRSKLKSILIGFSILFGIPVVAAVTLLSPLLVGSISRKFCYFMQPANSFFPNPFSALWTSGSGYVKCELIGYAGFKWHDIFSWLSGSWKTVLSLGSFTGLYAYMKGRQRDNRRHNADASRSFKDLSPEDQQSVAAALEVLQRHTGYYPSGTESPRPPLRRAVSVDRNLGAYRRSY